MMIDRIAPSFAHYEPCGMPARSSPGAGLGPAGLTTFAVNEFRRLFDALLFDTNHERRRHNIPTYGSSIKSSWRASLLSPKISAQDTKHPVLA